MSSAPPHWSVRGDNAAQANFRERRPTSSGTSTWHVSLKQRNLSGHCSLGGTTVDRMDSTTTCSLLGTADLIWLNDLNFVTQIYWDRDTITSSWCRSSHTVPLFCHMFCHVSTSHAGLDSIPASLCITTASTLCFLAWHTPSSGVHFRSVGFQFSEVLDGTFK